MADKSFKEIECLTHYKRIYDEDIFEGYLTLGTPVLVFEDGDNSQFGISAVELDEKDETWNRLFANKMPRGYGLVCGENRVLFRKFGSEQ